MVTIKDIAKKVGVSIGTVSMVLNKKKNSFISKKTREKILKAVAELNYIPNRIAKDLARGSTTILGVIIDDVKSQFFQEIIPGIENVASQNGYEVVVLYSINNCEKERKNIQALLERKVDGFIISPVKNNKNLSVFTALSQQKIPFVFIDRYLPEIDANFVVSNLKEGAFNVVSYLIQLGHIHIAHLTEKSIISTKKDVLEGYKTAFVKNGLKINEELIEEVDPEDISNDFDAGYIGMKKLLEKGKKFTAVFCIGDAYAIGAMKLLKEKNIKIPKDVSIVGMDNLTISSYVIPPLTSVAQDKFKMGKLACKILLEEIKNPISKKKQIFLKTNLILRSSLMKINHKHKD